MEELLLSTREVLYIKELVKRWLKSGIYIKRLIAQAQ